MPFEGRFTACISSQAGCAMNCKFCATGQMGFRRNLTSDEIFEQVVVFQRILSPDYRISNVVFMGMGEPFANYKNVMKACAKITSALNIGQRHITISTVGIVPKILRFAQEKFQYKLAISLHNPFTEERKQIVPITKKYSVEDLFEACYSYCRQTNRRITFEYCLIPGINDHEEHARKLASLLTPIKLLYHINLIALNATPKFKVNSKDVDVSVKKFTAFLNKFYVNNVTVRSKRGIDIAAGCGQLGAD
ncbi:probable dual-specificity RNA methyltransferase RlmN [Zophobas morio]|uniref:probable dual-specificity RNA methyltransferase RlmN n=1 Tax=Zophobas morio TaxID=2755281 RepID=UPI0030837686